MDNPGTDKNFNLKNSGAILYDPMVDKNHHSRNSLFNYLFRLKNDFYRNEDLNLIILHSYMVLNIFLNIFPQSINNTAHRNIQ